MKKSMIGLLVLALIAFVSMNCMATGYTNVVGGSSGLPVAEKGATYKLTGYVDFSEKALTTSDTMAVITIPAKTMVLGVSYEVTKATTNDIVVTIGDVSTTNQFTAASASTTNLISGVSLIATAKGYTTADQVRVLVSGAPGATGVIKVVAVVADLK